MESGRIALPGRGGSAVRPNRSGWAPDPRQPRHAMPADVVGRAIDSNPRRAALADVLSPLCFGHEFFQIGIQRIARRHDAYGFAVLDYGSMAKTVFVHHEQRVAE